jgi:uncharacterized protein involved in exopolysaccharide biosynthesis
MQALQITGNGLRNRYVERFQKRITDNPRLFVVIRQLFLADINALLAETKRELQEAADQCCQDITQDLDLLRGEQVAAVQDNSILNRMRQDLDAARTRLDAVIEGFEEAGL